MKLLSLGKTGFGGFAVLFVLLNGQRAMSQFNDPLPSSGSKFIGSWGASPSDPTPQGLALGVTPYTFANLTLREIVQMSVGAQNVLRIRLSNALSSGPVTFSDVHMAKWAGSVSNPTSANVSGTDVGLTFNDGQTSVTVPAGGEVVSDLVYFPVTAGTNVTVSFYIPSSNTTMATQHAEPNSVLYIQSGDASSSTVFSSPYNGFSARPYLSRIEVGAPSTSVTFVALGDSITDGSYTTVDGDTRWTDVLSHRLQTAYGNQVGVVNAGIGGNRLLAENGYGKNAQARFNQDVLAVPGVKFLSILLGTNDLNFQGAAGGLTASQLIAGFQSLIARAHNQGIYVYGGTILPFGSSSAGINTSANEAIRQQVNAFIRTGGAFDGVFDFDAALRDPNTPTQILAAYNSDGIHPNNAGYQAMANAVSLTLLNPATH